MIAREYHKLPHEVEACYPHEIAEMLAYQNILAKERKKATAKADRKRGSGKGGRKR